MPSRRDVMLGRVAPREIENGAVVPPALQVSELTLAEAQLRIEMTKGRWRPLDRAEAERIYGADEVAEVFA